MCLLEPSALGTMTYPNPNLYGQTCILPEQELDIEQLRHELAKHGYLDEKRPNTPVRFLFVTAVYKNLNNPWANLLDPTRYS